MFSIFIQNIYQNAYIIWIFQVCDGIFNDYVAELSFFNEQNIAHRSLKLISKIDLLMWRKRTREKSVDSSKVIHLPLTYYCFFLYWNCFKFWPISRAETFSSICLIVNSKIKTEKMGGIDTQVSTKWNVFFLFFLESDSLRSVATKKRQIELIGLILF